MSITLYSKPACPQCKATKRYLDKAGLEYEIVDLSQDAKALEYVSSLGYSAAPVVVAGEAHWSGFRISEIEKLATLADAVPEAAS